jgi:hypothetical protein
MFHFYTQIQQIYNRIQFDYTVRSKSKLILDNEYNG